MSIETTINQSPYSRSNTLALDSRPQNGLSNVGHGITQTLTGNLFNRSFPDGVEENKIFATFGGAPRTVVGAGVKNIQGGIKGTESFMEVNVGDVIALKIKDRVKVYESIVPSSNQIKFQCSLDYPPHGHVDKFLDAGEYEQFINGYREALPQAMAKTMYELVRFMFISSAFGACLPTREYDKLLLKTLSQTDNLPEPQVAARPFTNEVPTYSPMMQYMIHHRKHFKALSDELNRKISNIYVFDVQDIIYTQAGTRFNPRKPGRTSIENEIDAMKRLIKCLQPADITEVQPIPRVGMPDGADLIPRTGRMSREKSLKAFEIILVNIGLEVERPNTDGGQGNCGNTYKSKEANGQSDSVPAVLYPSNKGTTIMDKPMNQRPMLEVYCKKPNKILVMSRGDYNDFTGGAYKGGFGAESMGEINFGRVSDLFSEIIVIDGMVGGHAIIMDKRLFCLIPHLETTGRDTIGQRLVTMDTMHKGLIYGMFDQYVAARIQMTGFTANPLDMSRIFFSERDISLITNNYGSSDAIRL